MTKPMLDWDHIEEKIQSVIIRRETSSSNAQVIKKINQLNDLSPIWNGLLNKVEWLEEIPHKLTPQEKSLWTLIATLYYIEGSLSLIINYMIYSLMLKGEKIYINKRKSANTFDDLFKISLSIRLDFLNKHSYDFMFQICPTAVRNAIAHQDIKIEPDGTVIIYNKGKKVQTVKTDDLDGQLINICEFIEKFSTALKRVG